ncbi:hypothetical protein N5M11_000219 [Vibrio alginolyticus]|nr:hypothetical protein [Vibrio alginolyticus]MDF4874424.1 hypothetical protein [Vibrio parahaemolyticus]
MNTKKTSNQVASLAATTLQNPSASKMAKTLAGSVLAQSSTNKQTGADLEEKASKVLKSSKYSEDTKTLAGSVLSQSNKKR